MKIFRYIIRELMICSSFFLMLAVNEMKVNGLFPNIGKGFIGLIFMGVMAKLLWEEYN